MPIDKLFSNLLESPSAKGAVSGAASGALVSMLMNKKMRRKIGGSAAALGGAAALAGVGYFAYQKWKQHKPGTGTAPSALTEPGPVALPAPPLSLPPGVSDPLAMKMVKAMIAAAHSDGNVDEAEMARLEEAVHEAGLTPTQDAELMDALNTPPDVESLARLAASPEEAAEIYGAALAAIDPDTVSERFFLRRLARALALDAGLVETLHAEMGTT